MIIPESNIRTAVIGSKNTQQFGVSDNKVIFDILRNKLYVNPIRAICREISSNCRDANRESGLSDKPIEITIERDFSNLRIVGDSAISFKDSGIGIDPTRMNDVFLKYGESTKRETNNFTGGFGLGAKTPFAYSDSFSIKTICNYNGKRIKYFYVAAIDKEEKGTMYLFREEETNEDTGTTITIPLKNENIHAFEGGCMDILRGWEPKPIFNNFSLEAKNIPVKKIPFDGFQMWMNSDDNRFHEVELIIDDIPYRIPFNHMGFPNTSFAQIIIPFENGDLELSGSRESVQNKKENYEKIEKKLNYIKGIAKKWLDDYVEREPIELRRRLIYWKLHNSSMRIAADKSKLTEADKIAVTFNSYLNNSYSDGTKETLTLTTCSILGHSLGSFETQKRKTISTSSTTDLFRYYTSMCSNGGKLIVYLIDTENKPLFRLYSVLLRDKHVTLLKQKSFYDALNEDHSAKKHLLNNDNDSLIFSEVIVEELKKNGKINLKALETAQKEYERRRKLDEEALNEFFEIRTLSSVEPTRYNIKTGSTKKKTSVQLSFRKYRLNDQSSADMQYTEHCDNYSLDGKKHFKNFILLKARSIASESSGVPYNILKYLLSITFGSKYAVAVASVNYNTMIKLGASSFEDFVKNIKDEDLERIRHYQMWKHVDESIFEIFLNRDKFALDEKDLKSLEILENTSMCQSLYEKGFITKAIKLVADGEYIGHDFTYNQMKPAYTLLQEKIKNFEYKGDHKILESIIERYSMMKVLNVTRVVTGGSEKIKIVNDYLKNIQDGK